MADPVLPSPMCSAALIYARRGWPVFPCRERDGEPYINRKGDVVTPEAKAPYIGSGFKNATTDEAVITKWWRRWPDAMIGLSMGDNGLFAIDFDPRVDETIDPETGEVVKRDEWTLERLKASLEEQMGCPLPASLTTRTPSGGVHVYFKQPAGQPVRNRGNLPRHVDVRGKGGYVVAPPSWCEGGARASTGEYRFLHGRTHEEAIEAPAELIAILRAPKVPATINVTGDQPVAASPSPAPRGDDAVAEAVRKWGLSALDAECRDLAVIGATKGNRNIEINARAFRLGQIVGAGALTESVVRASLQAVVDAMPHNDNPAGARQTIENGLVAGMAQPRDLTSVTDRARERAERWTQRGERNRAASAGSSSPPPAPGDAAEGKQSFRVEGISDQIPNGGSGDDAIEALHRRCIFLPHTDLGNAERFFARFGDAFRWSPSLGWLGWDGRRWSPLEQEEKGIPSTVLDAVFKTVRAIQDEGDVIERSGAAKPDWLDEWEGLSEAERYTLSAPQFAEIAMYRRAEEQDGALDRVVGVKRGAVVTRAQEHRKFGRTSEANSKLKCIALLAQPWIAVAADAFDADPLAINVLNGTLRFRRTRMGDRWEAAWRLDPHDRSDLISKLAPVTFDREATCPIYDDMFAWAQPRPEMRRYLHQWGGLSMTGDMGPQILHYWYGRGGNGKSTTIDAWCAAIGDYTTTVPIETFLDQGVKKRGDQATPDLARLGGVRLLRTSEPERGAKLAAALVKLVTGGEPMSVRFLNRGFFDLRPIFKMTISGNYRPEIPDTDDGIWRRLKLIPWDQRVRDEQHPEGTRDKDVELPKKLLGELSGILNRLIAGLLDWLEHDLIEPDDVTAATLSYRTESDPLARFLKLCTQADPLGRVQSSHLHAVFVAWCKAAGEKEWTQKGFSKAMLDKGFSKKASDGMQWLGITLIRQASDFVDEHGKAIPFTLSDDDGASVSAISRARPIRFDDDDGDDYPP